MRSPQYVLQMPGPSWPSFLAAFFTAAFFIGLTVKLYVPAFACGVIAVVMVIWWMWDTDPGPTKATVDIGGGLRLPTYVTGPASHSWWAMIVLLLVGGTMLSHFCSRTCSCGPSIQANGRRKGLRCAATLRQQRRPPST